jgi:hypothetical protein
MSVNSENTGLESWCFAHTCNTLGGALKSVHTFFVDHKTVTGIFFANLPMLRRSRKILACLESGIHTTDFILKISTPNSGQFLDEGF